MKKYLLSFGVISSILFMGAGCGAPTQKETLNLGNGTSVSVTKNTNTIPQGFPSEISVYPGAEITDSGISEISTTNGDCKSDEKQNVKALTMMVKDKGVGLEAKKFYADAFTKAGWKIDPDSEMDMGTNGTRIVGFSAQKDNLKAAVLANESTTKDTTTPQTTIVVYVQQCIKK